MRKPTITFGLTDSAELREVFVDYVSVGTLLVEITKKANEYIHTNTLAINKADAEKVLGTLDFGGEQFIRVKFTGKNFKKRVTQEIEKLVEQFGYASYDHPFNSDLELTEQEIEWAEKMYTTNIAIHNMATTTKDSALARMIMNSRVQKIRYITSSKNEYISEYVSLKDFNSEFVLDMADRYYRRNEYHRDNLNDLKRELIERNEFHTVKGEEALAYVIDGLYFTIEQDEEGDTYAVVARSTKDQRTKPSYFDGTVLSKRDRIIKSSYKSRDITRRQGLALQLAHDAIREVADQLKPYGQEFDDDRHYPRFKSENKQVTLAIEESYFRRDDDICPSKSVKVGLHTSGFTRTEKEDIDNFIYETRNVAVCVEIVRSALAKADENYYNTLNSLQGE